ncbi:hypothetical protein AB1N83_008352 [Pleurotus pulmonarius]
MFKKQFTCFVCWFLRWLRLPKLLLVARKLFSMLRSALPFRKISSCVGLVRSSCGIITLPQEVLEMILSELDWKDVLRVRATCKLLCAASRSRSVWHVQHQRVSDSYDTPLNAMDGTATYAELERDTLHWARVQQDWVFRPTQPTQRLVCECPAVQIHLIPGGRWLLATDEDPFLYFHDLDSPNGQRHILIRLQDRQDKRVTSFAVDETNTTPYNVDMLIALNHEPNHDQFGRISIWRITSTPDDALTAHHVALFNTRGMDISFEMDLRGDYFARCANVDPTNWCSLTCIDVYDWQHSSTLFHYKATIVFGKEAASAIRILPGRRILAFEYGIVKIYSIDAAGFRLTPGKRPTASSTAIPLHTLDLPGMKPYILCPLYLDRLGTASLYLACARAAVKLTIPNDNQPPTVTDYLTYDEDNMCRALTLHRAYFRKHATATAFLLAHPYDEHWRQVWEIEDRNYDWGPLLDDYSGRIVECAWRRRTLTGYTDVRANTVQQRETALEKWPPDDAQRTQYNL